MGARKPDGNRGLSVENHFTRRGLDDPGRMPERLSSWRAWIARQRQASKDVHHFAQECAAEWRDFGQQPGTHLWLVWTGTAGCELRTADRQSIACLGRRCGKYTAIEVSGRTFTWKPVTGSSWPGIAQIVRQSHASHPRQLPPGLHMAASPSSSVREWLNLKAVINETGVPILYTSGHNYGWISGARITFPDRRWLRFPVRGPGPANAIMTAVYQDGDEVARYRRTGKLRAVWAHPIEIAVQPGHPLTDELVLAIAISAHWLSPYFSKPELKPELKPEVIG